MSIVEDQIIYTVQEIADFLKLSVLTIYKYIKEEELEAVEFGGHYRITQTALNRFITSHKVNKPDPNPIANSSTKGIRDSQLESDSLNQSDPNLNK